MRCFLHIGTAKTGSTAIQKSLAKARDVLVDGGYWYCQSQGSPANNRLAAAAMRFDRSEFVHLKLGLATPEDRRQFRETRRKSLRAEAHRAESVVENFIISSEHCHGKLVYDDEIEFVRKCLDENFDQVTIIMYIRPQIELAVSRYSTSLRLGDTKDGILSYKYIQSQYFDYHALYEKWASAFGAHNIIVKLHAESGDVVADFLRTVGCPEPVPSLRANESLNNAQAVFLKRFNREFPRTLDGTPNIERARLVALIAGAPGHNKPTVERARAQAFQAMFDDSNERLRSEIFPDRDVLFDIDWTRYPESVIDDVSEEEVFAVTAHVMRKLLARLARARRPKVKRRKLRRSKAET